MLIVMSLAYKKETSFWYCRCDCGNTKTIRSQSLTTRSTTSCGCRLKQIRHTTETQNQWFWPRANRAENGCLEWIKKIPKTHWYPRIGYLRKQVGAHRISWMLTMGDIPKGMCVCHKCDNPICIDPNHLFLGTMADNTRDMIKKGRRVFGKHHKGEDSTSAKLTNKQVMEIRRSNLSYTKLAKKYRIARGYIFHIKHRLTWNHI